MDCELIKRQDKVKRCIKWHEPINTETRWVRPVKLRDGLHQKKSCGIILHRYGEHGDHQVLLLKKRYTYAFSDMILGKYANTQDAVTELLSNMTREELLILYSLDFKMMWYHIQLREDKSDSFYQKEQKFKCCFMSDGGITLRARIMQTVPRGTIPWEIPKGRPLKCELELMCAIRELREETNIDKSDYFLIPGAMRTDVYVDHGTQYCSKYFIARAYPNLAKRLINARTVSQGDFREVGEIKWMNIEDIKFVDDEGRHMYSIIKPAINIVKLYNRGKWMRKF